MPDVIDFQILEDYKIKVNLSNGKIGVFDVTPYLEKGIFKELKEYNYFRRAKIEYGTLTWPNQQDFSPNTIELKMQRFIN